MALGGLATSCECLDVVRRRAVREMRSASSPSLAVEQQRIAEGVVPKVGPRTFERCKLFGNQHFEGSLRLALGAGGSWFESSRPDHFSRVFSGHMGDSSFRRNKVLPISQEGQSSGVTPG